MLWVGNFNAFIGCFVDKALGAYRVWKGALKNKRLHKNKWFLKIIQTGINPTTPDLTGSTGFVTKNHKYFSPLTSRICKCFIWQNSVFFETPCIKTVRNTHILDKQLKPYPINMTKCGATLIKNVSFDLHLIYAFNVSWHLWMFPVKKMGAHFKKSFKRLWITPPIPPIGLYLKNVLYGFICLFWLWILFTFFLSLSCSN